MTKHTKPETEKQTPQAKFKSYSFAIADFLRSPESEKFKLDIYHRMILRVIASYLDMREGICFAKQTTMMYECGMKEWQFRKSSKELVTRGLVIRTKSGKLYHYELSTVTGALHR
jgi:predicted transcriptional regulator